MVTSGTTDLNFSDVSGDGSVSHRLTRHHILQELTQLLLIMCSIRSGRLNQHVERVGLQRIGQMEVLIDGAHTRMIQELKRGQDLGQHAFSCPERLQHLSKCLASFKRIMFKLSHNPCFKCKDNKGMILRKTTHGRKI